MWSGTWRGLGVRQLTELVVGKGGRGVTGACSGVRVGRQSCVKVVTGLQSCRRQRDQLGRLSGVLG